MKRGDYEITKRGDEKIRTDPRMWEPRNKKCYERFPPKRADSFGPVGRLRARAREGSWTGLLGSLQQWWVDGTMGWINDFITLGVHVLFIT
jgi:hypothetical protein